MKANSECIKSAVQLLVNGRITEGLEMLKADASKGNSDALFALGKVYSQGIGVEPNNLLASEWLDKAAKSGHTEAILTLSGMYAVGSGVRTDVAYSMELCENAALLGESEGYTILGCIYAYGDYGVQKNISLGVSYFEKAICQRNTRAMYLLSDLLFKGDEIPKDIQRSFKLIDEAAELLDTDAMYSQGVLLENGIEGYIQDKKKALSVFRHAARLGNRHARAALQRFPELVSLGQAVGSTGFVSLPLDLRREMMVRHSVGDWGDMPPDEWEKNDAALKTGGEVYSRHDFGKGMVLLGFTEADRRSSFFEVEGEEYHADYDFWTGLTRINALYSLGRILLGR